MNRDYNLRIGILTIHAAINYGSMLQAYALQRYLEAEGNTVELIDYLPPCIMDGYSMNPLKHLDSPRQLAKYLVNLPARRKRNRVFAEFSGDCFRLSPRAYANASQLEADSDNWDVCLLGSDQVWNPDIVADDRAFRLEFAKNNYKACFSSSFGTNAIAKPYIEKLVQALTSFQKLSVREPSAVALLAGMEKPIAVTCDPVFLLSAAQWAELERKPKNVPEHYVLMYTVERNEKLEQRVKQLSDHYGIPVVDAGIRSNPRDYFGIHSPEYGPREFLYLVRHADYMVTNSFHGTAFGAVFHKKCISILHHSRGTRIRELAELTGRSRYILPEEASIEQMLCCLQMEQESDASGLQERIVASRMYLQDVLDHAKDTIFGG